MIREDTIGFRVRELYLAIKRAGPGAKDNACGAGCASVKTTRLHGWIIGYLYENRGREVYQRDIEKQLGVSRPTVSAILQLMEKNGLITREKGHSDARLKRLRLTETAIEVHRRHESEIEKFERSIRKGITESELSAFFGVMEKLKENLREAEGFRNGEDL